MITASSLAGSFQTVVSAAALVFLQNRLTFASRPVATACFSGYFHS
jgi:hypothetical protein